MLIFPTSIFGFTEKEIDVERQTLKGGTSLSGEQDVISTDGGGRVFAEFGGATLITRETNLAWRAVVTVLEEGVTRAVVPFCDTRHTPYGPNSRVPHSDQSPFSDSSLYVGGGATAFTYEAAALRATLLYLNITTPQDLLGGEWFSIEHPDKGWRAYRISSIEPQENGGFAVSFRPPLRQAVPALSDVELAQPRCLMVQDGRASTRFTNGRTGEAQIRFVEAP